MSRLRLSNVASKFQQGRLFDLFTGPMSSTFLIKQGSCFQSLKKAAGSQFSIKKSATFNPSVQFISAKRDLILPGSEPSSFGAKGHWKKLFFSQSPLNKKAVTRAVSTGFGGFDKLATTAPNANGDLGAIAGTPRANPMKYIVVTGGVVSGLGKGVTASSIGVVLKACGLRPTSIKIGER